MDLSVSSSAGALASAVQQSALGADVISRTLGQTNGAAGGASAAASQAYDFSKDVMNAAYAEKGIGTRLNSEV